MRYTIPVLLLAFVATAIAAPTTKPSFEIANNRLVLPGPVVFATGGADIKADSDPTIAHVIAYLEAKPYITLLRVEGHVARGDAEAQKLSEARALAITKALIAKGVDAKRLLPVGFGSTKPVADGSTPEGRAANSRIEFVNATLRNRPIGGMPIDGGGVVVALPAK